MKRALIALVWHNLVVFEVLERNDKYLMYSIIRDKIFLRLRFGYFTLHARTTCGPVVRVGSKPSCTVFQYFVAEMRV